MLDSLQPLLKTRALGRAAEFYVSIDSTNRRAAEWADAGAPHGALIVADHQTAGRGRHGRLWCDQPGLNLLFSIVLRPTLSPDQYGLITLAGGNAVVDAISTFCDGIHPMLKWPNDILVDGLKTCGMLLESRLGRSEPFVILGVGLNVNQVDFPKEVSETATSLRLATGQLLPRAPLLAHLLTRIEWWYECLEDRADLVRKQFADRMIGLGDDVQTHTVGGQTVRGTIAGLAENGALLLDTPTGVVTLHAGEVSFREPAEAPSR